MKIVSNKYKETMNQIIRPTTQFQAIIEMINRNAENDATVETSPSMAFSTSFFDKTHECDYITFEPDFYKIGSNARIAPKTIFLKNGFVSNQMSDNYGNFLNTPVLDFKFTQPYEFIGMTYRFSVSYPTQIRVTYYLSGSEKGQFTVTPNALEFTDSENHISQCDRIEFEFLSMAEPYRRLRISKLLFGIEKVFNTGDIISADHTLNVDPISSSLPSEKFKMTVPNYDLDYNPDNPHGIWKYFKNGLPLRIRYGIPIDNGTEWVDASCLYISDAPTVDNKTASFEACDSLSLLTNTYYKGPWRNGGISLYDLALDVLADAGVTSYSIPTHLKQVITYAPMPVLSHRECLQLIANAGRCVLYTGSNGKIIMKLKINADAKISDNGHYKWSSPKIIINGGSNADYITFEPDKWKVGNKSLFIAPENISEYKPIGFVSARQSDSKGNFVIYPTVNISYTLPVSSYRFTLGFDNINETCVKDFNLIFTNGGEIVKRFEVRNNADISYILDEEVVDYDLVTVEILSTIKPYQRVRIESISDGGVTDYYLDFSNAINSPKIQKTEELKSVDVGVNWYRIGSTIQELCKSDNVEINGVREIMLSYDSATEISATVDGGEIISSKFYAETAFLTIKATGNVTITVIGKPINKVQSVISTYVSDTGESCPVDNPLITNALQAQRVGEWVADYLKCRNSYETNFRQDFRLDINDIIYIQTDFEENIPARITKLQYKLPGQEGAIKVRRLN